MSDQQSPTDAPQEAVEAPETGQETPQESQPDILAQMNDRFSQIESGFTQRFDQLKQSLQPPQEENPYDPYGTFQPQQDEFGGLDPNDPRDAALLQQHQALQSIQAQQQQFAAQAYAREVNEVLQQYPDLQKPEVAQPVMDLLRQAGYDVDSESPSVPPKALEMAFKAHQADQYAQQQKPLEQQDGPSLEQGGAMQPAPDKDPADELLGPKPQQTAAFPWAVR